MAHDVFVSYAGKDKSTADAIVAALEGRRVRCWIAPRDVPAGSEWAGSIGNAISAAKAMIVVLSMAANASRQVVREVERAVNMRLVIVPFRVDNAAPSASLEYLVSSCHSGSSLELTSLKEQARIFMGELALPAEVVTAVFATFESAKKKGDLVQNAKQDLTTRNTMSSLLATPSGDASAAVLRLGSGIVNLMPQFEFLEMGEGHGLPWAELAGPMQDQIENLAKDGQLAGVDEKLITMLRNVSADPKKARAARALLMMVGGAVDTSLGQAAG